MSSGSCYRVQVDGYEKNRFVLYNLVVNRGTNEWRIQRRFSDIWGLNCVGLENEIRNKFLPTLMCSRFSIRQHIYGRQSDKFLEMRMSDIQRYFDKILQITSIEQSKTLNEFLFSDADMKECRYPGSAAEYAKAVLALPSIDRSDCASKYALQECPICLNDSTSSSDGPMCILPCQHIFHTSCISRWLARKNMCCMCRQVVIPCRQTSQES